MRKCVHLTWGIVATKYSPGSTDHKDARYFGAIRLIVQKYVANRSEGYATEGENWRKSSTWVVLP
jgi:hypothetical protein